MKKTFVMLLCPITIILISGCESTNNTETTPSVQTTHVQEISEDYKKRDAVETEIENSILSCEHFSSEIEFVLLTDYPESTDLTVDLLWSESSSIFLTECYYMIPIIKDILNTYSYSNIEISISSEDPLNSKELRLLTYKSNHDISFVDSSGVTFYSYDELNALSAVEEENIKPDTPSIIEEESHEVTAITSGDYDIAEISFQFSDFVQNDSTGRWKISLISSSKEVTDYSIEYYNTLFSSDDEIHAIINSASNTTNKISLLYPGMLDITVYKYVNGEESDANILFSGVLLNEYFINTETGEIEKIQ